MSKFNNIKNVYISIFEKSDKELINPKDYNIIPDSIIQNIETSKLLDVNLIMVIKPTDYFRFIFKNKDKNIYLRINETLHNIKKIDFKYFPISKKLYKVYIYI